MLQKYTAFVALCLGFFILMMDTTTVPFIYTSLMNVFNVSPGMVAWANNIYLITYAASLLVGGRLGDFTNRKIIILTAYITLGVGAGISGAGHTFVEVIIGRAVMGVGAGLLTPQSMAYISILFAKGGRGMALGIWGAVAGIATATGPVITQIFLTTANWRWVMWINIPIAIVCFLIATWSLPSEYKGGLKFLNTAVSSLYGICIAGAIIGIQFMSNSGSRMIMGFILFVIGATSAATLIKNDLKNGYILSPEIWFDSVFIRTCLTSGLLGAGLTGFYLPLAFLLDVTMKFSPIAISMVMIIISLSCALVGPFAGRFSDRIEPERIIRLGLILFALANVLLGFIGVHMSGGTLALVAICLVMTIAGAGAGLAFAPLANLALGRVRPASIGQAAAFFNSVRQIMSALGGVIIAIVFDSIMRSGSLGKLEIIHLNIRQSTNSSTAIASMMCFLLVALSLAMAAYISNAKKARQSAVEE